MCQVFFFHLNFLNVQGILAQKINNVHAIFCQFSDFKNGTIPTTKRPRAVGTGISRRKER